MPLWKNPFFVRNLVYGIEDSLISTTGFVVGVTFAGLATPTIVVASLVLILVEALSMSFGAFLAEESFLYASDARQTTWMILSYALTMFLSYFLTGLVVIVPYLFNVRYNYAYSLGIAIASLYALISFSGQGGAGRALALTAVGAAILAVTVLVGRAIDRMTDLGPGTRDQGGPVSTVKN